MRTVYRVFDIATSDEGNALGPEWDSIEAAKWYARKFAEFGSMPADIVIKERMITDWSITNEWV